MRCLTSHLDRTCNDLAQNCRCLYNHSPTSIEAGDTRIILVVTRIDICEWMIIKAAAFLGVYILFKCDVRHRLHCLVSTDTNLLNIYEGKNLPCKSKMASYYVFTTSMLWRGLFVTPEKCLQELYFLQKAVIHIWNAKKSQQGHKKSTSVIDSVISPFLPGFIFT